MEITDKKIILDIEEDYEFAKLIHHIIEVEYGRMEIIISRKRPQKILEKEKSIFLTKSKKSC